jgi:putative ABC transport system ATP-binding protein
MSARVVVALEGVSHAAGSGPLRAGILHEVSASVRAGEIVLLTGPSGSGKTTLLTLVGALRAVQRGSLRVLDHELHGAPQEIRLGIRRRVGWVFQLHNLLRALTVRQNVRTGLRAVSRDENADELVDDVLRQVGLESQADRHPDRLSVGQRQRVAVARALVAHPRLILADEPTAALDRRSGREVIDCLCRLARESRAAVLLVTHDERVLEVGDRVLRMEEGRLAEIGKA